MYPIASLIFLESKDWPKLTNFHLVISSSIGDGGLAFSAAVMSAYKTVDPIDKSAF